MAIGKPQRGEIWIVDFDPTVGSEIQKARPAVVVNAHLVDLLAVRIAVPLSSWQPKFKGRINVVFVKASPQNGLDRDSAADVVQVRCVAVERFTVRKGVIEADALEEIVAGVALAVDYQA
jgi:mRNA interferase MazF